MSTKFSPFLRVLFYIAFSSFAIKYEVSAQEGRPRADFGTQKCGDPTIIGKGWENADDPIRNALGEHFFSVEIVGGTAQQRRDCYKDNLKEAFSNAVVSLQQALSLCADLIEKRTGLDFGDDNICNKDKECPLTGHYCIPLFTNSSLGLESEGVPELGAESTGFAFSSLRCTAPSEEERTKCAKYKEVELVTKKCAMACGPAYFRFRCSPCGDTKATAVNANYQGNSYTISCAKGKNPLTAFVPAAQQGIIDDVTARCERSGSAKECSRAAVECLSGKAQTPLVGIITPSIRPTPGPTIRPSPSF